MHEDINTNKKRQWIKKASIIFLILLLVFTFFSNTFMNYSLAKVATVVVSSKTIEEKIRGNGIIESADNYDHIIKDTRTVEFVNVKVGDEVKQGDILMKLEATDIEELKKAKEDLIQLKADYQTALLKVDYVNYIKDKEQVRAAKEDLQKAIERKNRIQRKVKDLDTAEETFQKLDKEVKDLRKRLADADNDVVTHTYRADLYKGKLQDVNNGIDENVATYYENYKLYKYKYDDAEREYNILLEEKEALQKKMKETGYESLKDANKEYNRLVSELNKLYNTLNYVENAYSYRTEENPYSYTQYQKDKTAASTDITETNNAINQVNSAIVTLKPLEDKLTELNGTITQAKSTLQQYKDDYIDVERQYEAAKTSESGDYNSKLIEAEKKLEAANEKVNDIKADLENRQEEKEQAQKNLDEFKTTDAEVNQKSAVLNEMIAGLDFKKSDDHQNSRTTDVDIQALQDKIALKQKEVDRLTKRQNTTEITAKVDGTVSAVNVNSGGTALANSVVCSIKAKGKGYKLSIKVTNEQSKKVKVGDAADVQSMYEGIKAVVSAIKASPEDPANSKLIVFDVKGENVKLGQSLLVFVGSNSNKYDYVVPSSSVYTDNKGKFIYLVKVKNSALGNRYIVKKVPVKISASNDTQSAITGELAVNDMIVNSASKPISNGDRVMIKNEDN